MSRILEPLRVLDLSSTVAGLRASGQLADYGADVVWVEPPGGAELRRSAQVECAVYNRRKRSIELDLIGPSPELSSLLDWADVLIETFRDGEALPLGLGYDAVHAAHPHLVHVSITGFGTDGPHKDVAPYESLVHALIGSHGEQVGHRDGPVYQGLPFASLGAGYLAAIGTLAAVHARARDGVGRHVETSLYDGALVYLAMLWGDSDTKVVDRNHTENTFMPAGATRLITGAFRCADDEWIGVHTGAVGAFGRLMALLGLDDRIPSDPSGMDMGILLTDEQQAILHGNIHDIFAQHPRDWWVEKMVDADVCGIAAYRPTECYDQPQTVHNNMVITVDDPVLGATEQVAPPARFSIGGDPVSTPAPTAGAHTTEVLAEAAMSAPHAWMGTEPADVTRPLLEGVRILDLGAMYAGPCSSRHLADFGADVIKLEPTLGDGMRGLTRIFRVAQAGKRSLAANLKDPGLDDAREALIDWADIVHHNMRPGAAERMGVGRETVQAQSPGTIYGYAPGWGADGPFMRRQSFEPMLSGYVGVEFEVAGQYNPPLYPLGNADPGNAMVGALSMLISLLHRSRTGESVYFEHPQLNATMTHTSHIVRSASGEVLGAERLDPMQYGFSALDRLYETADGWLCVAVGRDDEIRGLSAATGVEILTDPRFADVTARADNDFDLSFALEDVFRGKDTASWVAALADGGVPAAVPLPYNGQAFMRDPENRRTRRVAEVPSRADGNVREPDQYLRFSHTTLPAHRLAPELGEHTDQILTWLGYDQDRIEALAASGAIFRDTQG